MGQTVGSRGAPALQVVTSDYAARERLGHNSCVGLVSRSRASFRIGADLFFNPPGVMPDASAVTRSLGIEPTRTHNAGEAHGPRLPVWKHGQWALDSPLPEDSELEAHLKWLLDRLLPIRDRLATLIQSDPRLKVDFFCGLWLQDSNEELELSPDTLQGIAALGAPLRLDIYYRGRADSSSS